MSAAPTTALRMLCMVSLLGDRGPVVRVTITIPDQPEERLGATAQVQHSPTPNVDRPANYRHLVRWLFVVSGGLFLVVGVLGLAMWMFSDRKRREYAALGSRPVDSLALIGVGLLFALGGVLNLAWIPLLGAVLVVVTADRQRTRRARLDRADLPPMFRHLDAMPRNPLRSVLYPGVYTELFHVRRNRREIESGASGTASCSQDLLSAQPGGPAGLEGRDGGLVSQGDADVVEAL